MAYDYYFMASLSNWLDSIIPFVIRGFVYLSWTTYNPPKVDIELLHLICVKRLIIQIITRCIHLIARIVAQRQLAPVSFIQIVFCSGDPRGPIFLCKEMLFTRLRSYTRVLSLFVAELLGWMLVIRLLWWWMLLTAADRTWRWLIWIAVVAAAL